MVALRAIKQSSDFDELQLMADGEGEHIRPIGWTTQRPNAIVDWMATTVAAYPDYKQSVQRLVDQHRKLKNGHLRLAVYLAPPKRPKRDIYLFEVIDDFGGGHIDPSKKLFTFAYGSTPGFPLPESVRLWMILTNPVELDAAIDEKWKRVGEIRNTRKAGKALVLYADTKGKKFWNRIK
jgi:hypothetical protein